MPDNTSHSTQDPGELRPLDEDEEAVVRALRRVMYSLPRALEADMVREQHMPLSEYVALMHLSEVPDRQLRMSDLAAACELSVSGMTRIVQRLESQEYVQRVKCEQDGRGWNAVLTDRGLARLENAYPTNLAALRRYFFDHLVGLDLKKLAAALQNVGS